MAAYQSGDLITELSGHNLRADGRWKYFSFGFMGEAVWDTVLDKDAVREGMRPIEQGMTITDRTVSERALT